MIESRAEPQNRPDTVGEFSAEFCLNLKKTIADGRIPNHVVASITLLHMPALMLGRWRELVGGESWAVFHST